MKIFNQKDGKLTRDELYQLGGLLVKAGYTVSAGAMYPPGKTSGSKVPYMEAQEKDRGAGH